MALTVKALAAGYSALFTTLSHLAEALESAPYPSLMRQRLRRYTSPSVLVIDEVGYVLVSANDIRLREAYPAHLSRSGMVDWGALLGLMSAAADQQREPFVEAVHVQERLFTTAAPIP